MITLFRGGAIIDTEAQRLYRGDLLVENGIISRIEGEIAAEEGIQIEDASGLILSPGFIDSHIHIESSMLSPSEFARLAVCRGTTCVLTDPHEIANVFGTRAVEFIIDLSRRLPLDLYVGIPSCVPATNLEHAGASISPDDVARLLKNDRVYGLAEMMDYEGIIWGDEEARRKVDIAFEAGKIVDGHCPGLAGKDLLSYISNGRNDGRVRIMNDHETLTTEEAIEKLNAGMTVNLRYGSATRDIERILPGLVRNGIDLSACTLCSDDLSPSDLLENGHVDRIIKRARDLIMQSSALDLEASTLLAITMATKNAGNFIMPFLKLEGHPPVGRLRPGYRANITLLRSLENLEVARVYLAGKKVAENGRCLERTEPGDLSPFTRSINIPKPVTASDFSLSAEKKNVRLIEVVPQSLLTKMTVEPAPAAGRTIAASATRDIAKVTVLERHHDTGSRATGLVKGLGLQRGALASTVAHDSHNLIVAGMDDESMARAANHLIENNGGMVVVDGREITYFPLHIAGLMSLAPVETVVREYHAIKDKARSLGSPLENVFMTLAFLALPVIPEMRITDMGLVDSSRLQFIPLAAD